MDGVILLDKALGFSSNQALQRVKWLLNAAKAGHTGTLDPDATGLLVLCFGEATKLAGIGLDEDKTYEATIQLGVATDSGDAQGKVIASKPFSGTDDQIERALAAHRGPIQQVPPMYSALKRDGKPLYDYARAGIELEREPRAVTIHELTLLERQSDRLRVRVACSKGTYIRVLAEQIGGAMDSPAHLVALRRTRVGNLDLSEAVTVAALEEISPEKRLSALHPPEILLKSVPSLMLDGVEEAAIRQGQAIQRALSEPGMVRLHGPSGALIGLAQTDANGTVQPRRLLLPPKNFAVT